MTDEEMAEQYVSNQGDDNILYFGEDQINLSSLKREAYLAGLKAGNDMAEADLATIAFLQGAEWQKRKLRGKK